MPRENYGIFHVEDFRLHHIQKLLDRIAAHGARRVMLFTSSIVAPIFESLVTLVPEFARCLEDVELYVETVDDNSFGGNYDVMDSRVVEDYARIVRMRIADGIRPDLILCPDAFGGSWGMDIHGDSVERLAMEVGVPVERIDWLLVYGREV